jgi:hypothetical protein
MIQHNGKDGWFLYIFGKNILKNEIEYSIKILKLNGGLRLGVVDT